jgi:hypothetical protein
LAVIAREDGIERDRRTGQAGIWHGDLGRRLREAGAMEGRGANRRPAQLMTEQMLADELGLPKSLAATIFQLAKRGPVHLAGFRRTFARRADVERFLEGSGALGCTSKPAHRRAGRRATESRCERPFATRKFPK